MHEPARGLGPAGRRRNGGGLMGGTNLGAVYLWRRDRWLRHRGVDAWYSISQSRSHAVGQTFGRLLLTTWGDDRTKKEHLSSA
jgi:hypothetical protein